MYYTLKPGDTCSHKMVTQMPLAAMASHRFPSISSLVHGGDARFKSSKLVCMMRAIATRELSAWENLSFCCVLRLKCAYEQASCETNFVFRSVQEVMGSMPMSPAQTLHETIWQCKMQYMYYNNGIKWRTQTQKLLEEGLFTFGSYPTASNDHQDFATHWHPAVAQH